MKFKNKKQHSNENLAIHQAKVYPLIEKTVCDLGFRLFKSSFVNENQINYLRITVTHFERKITIDDCELISKKIEKELDKSDLIPFQYFLEVQSPGIESEEKSNNNNKEHKFFIKSLGLVVRS